MVCDDSLSILALISLSANIAFILDFKYIGLMIFGSIAGIIFGVWYEYNNIVKRRVDSEKRDTVSDYNSDNSVSLQKKRQEKSKNKLSKCPLKTIPLKNNCPFINDHIKDKYPD